jgi:predicted GNAT superfamily acetyltransferase
MDYVIRPFEDVGDHEQCEIVQQHVWGGNFVVPANMTITLQRHGGVAIGAFDRDGRMIGFVVGFLSPTHHEGANKGLSHHSHIAAVAPEWQGRGVGEALKRAQGEAVRAQGLNLVTWTFDPLEAKNARLNIAKLGCICRTFIRNAYGNMNDVLNAGLPSDRFEVEWWLDQRIENEELRMANDHLAFSIRHSRFSIDIPRDFQSVKRTDIDAAWRWRLETRERFERAFADGFVVTNFTLTDDRAFYALARTLSHQPPT